jgi:hypothetical protein
MKRRQILHLAAGAATLPAASRIASAQAYPTRPIMLIVPFPSVAPPDNRESAAPSIEAPAATARTFTPQPGYLAEVYRKIAVRYVFMAEGRIEAGTPQGRRLGPGLDKFLAFVLTGCR